MGDMAAKPTYSYLQVQSVLSAYRELLRLRPLLTKSITSGVISCAGSCIAQLATQPQGVSSNVARAFLVYGGLVTGPVTHYFYILLDRAFPGSGLASRLSPPHPLPLGQAQ